MKTVFRALLVSSLLLATLFAEARPFGPGFPGGGPGYGPGPRPPVPGPFPPGPSPRPGYPGRPGYGPGYGPGYRPGYPYPPRPIPGPIYPAPVYPLPGPAYPIPVPAYPIPGFDVCQGVFTGRDTLGGGFVQFVINRIGGDAINVTMNFNGQVFSGTGICNCIGGDQAQVIMNIYGGTQQNATIMGNVMNGVESPSGIGFTTYRQ